MALHDFRPRQGCLRTASVVIPCNFEVEVFSFGRDARGHEVDFVAETGREKITLSPVASATLSASATTL